jgi:hypothetical protein
MHFFIVFQFFIKYLTTPETIDKIHELILKDRPISSKLIAEQMVSHMSVLCQSLMKIWTYGSSSRSGSRIAERGSKSSKVSVVWKFFGAIQIISSRAQLLTMDETWLYHYDPEKKYQ